MRFNVVQCIQKKFSANLKVRLWYGGRDERVKLYKSMIQVALQTEFLATHWQRRQEKRQEGIFFIDFSSINCACLMNSFVFEVKFSSHTIERWTNIEFSCLIATISGFINERSLALKINKHRLHSIWWPEHYFISFIVNVRATLNYNSRVSVPCPH